MIKITAHTMVKNEARFVWFAINSVINYVDEFIIFDTGSEDGTLEIIEEIKKRHPDKVKLKRLENISFSEEDIRQQMLDLTTSEWFLVVDGDEIWWDNSISTLTENIRNLGENYESIVIPTVNVVGDMYHFQEPQAGNYHLAGRIGHYNLRGVNTKISGLHSLGVHGVWGWVDQTNRMIQDREQEKILFLNAPYLHTTFLPRAGILSLEEKVEKRVQKYKHELGIPFPKDYFYPEVFFRERPTFVRSVWEPMTKEFYLQSVVETPLRQLKRRILPKKVGY